MSANELKVLLDDVADTRELVLRRAARWEPVHAAWTDASEEAAEAYRRWRTAAGRDAYAVYRAAQDRVDAAQDALAAELGRRGVPGRPAAAA